MRFTMLAFVISYLVKPIGALIFGHLIDVYGRKKILVLTASMMFIATSSMGFLPVSILGWGMGVGLILCRVVQGISISGEFPTGIIMAVEQGRVRQGFTGSLAFIAGSLGLVLAHLSVYLVLKGFSHEQILKYGWRLPFIISMGGCFALLLLRGRIEIYQKAGTAFFSGYRNIVRVGKERLLRVLAVSSLSASAFYITFVHMPTWLSARLQVHSHTESLLMTLLPLLAYVIFLPAGGLLADRIGVEKQIKIASLLYLGFSGWFFAALPYLGQGAASLMLICYSGIQALLNSALPVYIVLGFQENERGKGLALSYNISLTLFGGLMPYLLLTSDSSINPGLLISVCSIFALLALFYPRRRSGYLRSESVS